MASTDLLTRRSRWLRVCCTAAECRAHGGSPPHPPSAPPPLCTTPTPVQNIFVIFIIALFASKLGGMKLGHDDDVPDFPTASWFMMVRPPPPPLSLSLSLWLLYLSHDFPVRRHAGPIGFKERGHAA